MIIVRLYLLNFTFLWGFKSFMIQNAIIQIILPWKYLSDGVQLKLTDMESS